MRNKKTKQRETDSGPIRREWTPPRGIRLFELKDRPDRSHAVQWRVDGNVTTRTFPTKEAQVVFAKALAADARDGGIDAYRLNADEAREWRAFRADIGPDTPLDSVLACWRKYGSTEAAASPLVADLVQRYFSLREEEKSWGADAARHARTQLGRFVAKFGGRRVGTITRDDIRGFLFGRTENNGRRVDVLVDDEGQPIGPHGVRDHRKNLNTFFQYCLRERWGLVDNECAYVKPPRITDDTPPVIPLRDAFEFFKANRDERVIGRVALEAFGFIRYTTAGKLTRECLDFDRKGIRLPASQHKTGQKDGRTRYRQGHPDNLWAWLKHAPDSCWEMTPLQYREGKRIAAIRGGLRPVENVSAADEQKLERIHNVWRHSVISYHLARYENPGLTQRLAQHASYKQTEAYEGIADAETAARYFLISPDSVLLTWEQFLALPIPPLHGIAARYLPAESAAAG